MDHLLTQQRVKCGPLIDPTKGKMWTTYWPYSKNTNIYIYIYIYMHAVGSTTWPHFGHFNVNNLATVGSITWPPFFEPIKIGVLRDLLVHSFQGVVQN